MGKTARDIMTRNVIVVEDNASINKLIGIFVENKISCVPVVNNKNKLIGIVTKTDVLSYFMDIDLHISLNENLKDILEYGSEYGDLEITSDTDVTVGTIMTQNPIIVEENCSIEFLAKTMIEHNIHRLIVKKDNDIAGIVSTLDILYYVGGIDKK